MEKIINQSHGVDTYLFSISRLFERISYYGLRILIVAYVLAEFQNIPNEEVFSFYGHVFSLIVLFQIIGGLLGDLVIGNKNSIILGGLLQAFGAFCLCYMTQTGLYLGLFSIIVGTGLVTPNILANFGKVYISKPKLLDAGFTILFLSFSIAGVIGTAGANYINVEFDFKFGFILCGIFLFFSVLPILFTKDIKLNKDLSKHVSTNYKAIVLIIIFFIICLYWFLIDLSYGQLYSLEGDFFEFTSLGLPDIISSNFISIFTLPACVLLGVIWTYFYTSQSIKLLLGFICGALTLVILFNVSEFFNDQSTVFFLSALFLIGLSELLLLPIIYSIVTKYTNPKYLAIIMSLIFVPMHYVGFMCSKYSQGIENHTPALIVLTTILFVIVIICIMVYTFTKNKRVQEINL